MITHTDMLRIHAMTWERDEARRQIQQLHRKWISEGNAAGAFLEACAEHCNETDFRMSDERED